MYSKKLSHITPIRGINDDGLGKKHALSKLIHASDTEYIWMHDDDVLLPSAASEDYDVDQLSFASCDLLILPLRMVSQSDSPSLLERLQIAEYAAIQNLTISSAQNGHPVMCSGANLIARREAWIECEPELHPEIPSGDDMFLLEAMKRHSKAISVSTNIEYVATIRPLTTWRALWRQRTRWAGKAPHYTDRDIRRCGALTLLLLIMQAICPILCFVYLPFEWKLINRYDFSHNKQFCFWDVLLLSFFYPYYALACVLGGVQRGKTW